MAINDDRNSLLSDARRKLRSPSGSGREMSRQELAEAVNAFLWSRYQLASGVDGTYIGHLEQGRYRWPNARRREAFRHLLGVDADAEIGFYINRGSPLPPQPRQVRLTASGPVSSTEAESAALPGPVLPSSSHRHVTALRSLRAADKQVGGGHLYPTVVAYLSTNVAPTLLDAGDEDERVVFTSAAALTEMAGWMAHDAGQDLPAQRHFSRALKLARIGGDQQLQAHIYASMSHLAHHQDRPADGIQFARTGHTVLSPDNVHPQLTARLLALEARGHASLRRGSTCTGLLRQAEDALVKTPQAPRSTWASPYDEASLSIEIARCTSQLGAPGATQRSAERAVALRAGPFSRSRALGQLLLAAALVAQKRPDEACVVGRQAIAATPQLGSVVIVHQLVDLKTLLKPFQNSTDVADFLSLLDDAVRDRAWLQSQQDNQPAAPGASENQ